MHVHLCSGLNPRWTKELERETQERGTIFSNPERTLAYYRKGAGKTVLNHVSPLSLYSKISLIGTSTS